MNLGILDIIGDELSADIIPNLGGLVVVSKDGCMIPEPIARALVPMMDLSRVGDGGRYLVRVSNDVQRGVVLALIFSYYPEATVLTPRPDVIRRYLANAKLSQISTGLQATPAPQIRAPQEPPRKPQDLFDLIYMDTLDKYRESILSALNRATKEKAAKSQMKNIASGVIQSKQVKNGIQVAFTADDIVEALFGDLERMGIIAISASSVEYFDEYIEAFFGRNKCKVFAPLHRSGGQPGRKEEVKVRVDEEINKTAQEIIGICLGDTRLENCANYGMLNHVIKGVVASYFTGKRALSEAQNQMLMGIVSTYFVKEYFSLENPSLLEGIANNPNQHFFAKLIKKA
jgi:hypothetical protein